MFIAFIILGAFAGAVTAVTALIMGASLWAAFLIYSGAGVAAVILGVAAFLLVGRFPASQRTSAFQLKARGSD